MIPSRSPRTDRERLHQLEARNADLEAEILEWRRQEAPHTDDEAMWRLRDMIHLTKCRSARGTARLILGLIAAHGRVLDAYKLAGIVIPYDPDRDMDANPVRVYVSKARKALRELGISGTVENVWGRGYRLAPATAAEIMAKIGSAS